MAETRPQRTESGKQAGQALARQERGIQRWDPYASFASPLDWMDRISDEMDRVFDRMVRDFGSPRRSALWGSPIRSRSRTAIWSPRVEAFQKGDRFIVRAELPGLKKEDVQVELTDDALTIHGERRDEREEEREGYFHSEREYGQFHRTIPLPDGVISESAQASFRSGVLEVSMQAAPAEANRGRKLEIKDASEGEPKK
jgi:HSP20 family protein